MFLKFNYGIDSDNSSVPFKLIINGFKTTAVSPLMLLVTRFFILYFIASVDSMEIKLFLTMVV